MNRDQQKAVSLLELLIALTVLGLLLSILPPSYSHLVKQNRDLSVRNELIAHLNFARTEAITTGRSHIICGSGSGNACDGGWSRNWLVLRSHDQKILRRFTPSQQPDLCWRGFGGEHILFRANGMNSASNGRFTLCREKQPLWQIVINRQGRLKIDKPNNSMNCCETDRTDS